jgi:hypothetical protein
VTLVKKKFLNIQKISFFPVNNLFTNDQTENNNLAEACLEDNFILQLEFTISENENGKSSLNRTEHIVY